MKTTYHELVGCHVVDSTGKKVGRVADLRAEDIGGSLRITGLLVGERELLARFGLRVARLIGQNALPGYFIPWRAIKTLGKTIRLDVRLESLDYLSNVTRPFETR